MQVIIREIYDFLFLSQNVLEPIASVRSIFMKRQVTEWRESNNTRLRDCELNYFPLGEAYSSSLVAEEQKRHPFWFLLFRTLPLRTSFMLFRLNRSTVATIHRLSFFPSLSPPLLFLTQCVYAIRPRGWIAARFNSDLQTLDSFRGLTSFFPLPLRICR